MAAAAAAREAAERERRALLQAAARERREKQVHADLGKLERLKEVERVGAWTHNAVNELQNSHFKICLSVCLCMVIMVS